MTYGLNFGAQDIPRELRKHFRTRIRRPIDGKLEIFCLVGCTDSAFSIAPMTVQADNGHRKLHWEQKTWTTKEVLGSSNWYAVYAH